MGQTTPNIGIYIPAAGETNYDASFAAGQVNVDQHDHSGGPNKGVPIASSGIADGSITYPKLNANVADNTTGIGTNTGLLANQLIILGLLKNIFQIATTAGFISKDGSSAHARTLQPTANQTTVSNGDGVAGDPAIGLVSTPQVTGISFDAGAHSLSSYVSTTAWTPAITFGGGSTGITYGSRTGKYVRIGNIVFYTFEITLTNKGSSTGIVQVTGLPVAASAAGVNPTGTLSGTITNTASATQFYTEVVASSSSVTLGNTGAGQDTQLTDSQFSNTSTCDGSGWYFV